MQSISHLSFLHTFLRLFMRNIQTAVSSHPLKIGHMFIWTYSLGILPIPPPKIFNIPPKAPCVFCVECIYIYIYIYIYIHTYTGCPRRNVPVFGRVFLMLKYTDITQNTYVQSWTVTEIMARERCGLLGSPRTVPVSWQVLSMFVLECGVRYGKSAHTSLTPECAVSHVKSLLAIHVSCIVLRTLRTTMTCVRVFFVVQFNGFMSLTS